MTAKKAKTPVKKPPVKPDPLKGGEYIRISEWKPDDERSIPTLHCDTVDAGTPFRFATTKAKKLLRGIEEVGIDRFMLMLRHVAAYNG